MAPAKDPSRAVPAIGPAATGCPIGALHDQRLTAIEARLADHSGTLDQIQARLSQGDVSFAEVRKDLEQLTNEVRGIKGILAWVGAAVGGGVLSAGGAALLWAIRAAPAGLVIVLLMGCTSARTDSKTTTTAHREVTVAPVELATPLGPITSGPIRIEAREKQEATTKSNTETTISPQALPTAAPIVAAAGGGLTSWAGGLAGLGGVISAIWAFMAKRRTEQTLGQVVAGVEAAKEQLAQDQLARLLASLDSCMDTKAKQQVRDWRARL